MSTTVKLALRYLWGRKLRTFLTSLAVVFGIMLLFGLNAILPGMMQAFKSTLLASVGEVDMTVTSRSANPFDESLAERVREVDGVAGAAGSLHRPVALPPDGYELSAVQLVGIDPERSGAVRPIKISQGRALVAADDDPDAAPYAAVLPVDVASQLDVGVGDVFRIPSTDGMAQIEVVGLADIAVVPGQEEVYLALSAAQALVDLPGRVSEVDVAFDAQADREQVQQAVEEEIGSSYNFGTVQNTSTLFASMRIGQFMLSMFGVFALAMAGFIILNTFRTIVAERRHDIGMLRAVGASRRTIIGIFLTESLIQGVLGTVLGLLAGWGLAVVGMRAISDIYSDLLNIPASDPIFTPGNFAASIGLGIGITVLSAILPARAASRITPLDALRPHMGDVREPAAKRRAWVGLVMGVLAVAGLISGDSGLVGLSSVVFLVALVLVTPVITKPVTDFFAKLLEMIFAREGGIARANLQRNPGRAATTASTMMVSVAIVLALLGVIVSIFDGFIGYVDKSMGADFLLVPQNLLLQGGTVGAGEQFVRDIEDARGVGDVATLSAANAGLGDGTIQVVGIDPVKYPKVASFEFSEGSSEGDLARLADPGTIMVNGIFAAQQGVGKGDELTLETPEGAKQYEIVAVGSDYLNAKLATTYVSQDSVRRDWGINAAMLVMANAEQGADKGQVMTTLEDLVEDYPTFRLYDTASWRELQVNTFEQTLSSYYVLMVILALPSLLALINTLAIGVLARTREIGMLRAVGSTRRQVGRIVLAESLLLSALGTTLGVIAGIWLGFAMTDAMNNVGFTIPYYFPWNGIVAGLAIGLFFGVAAAFVPARQATKLDIVAALKYE